MPILTRWVQYFQRGVNTFRDGREPFVVDQADIETAVAEAEKWGKPYPVDWVHASLPLPENEKLPFPDRYAAAGRILALEGRDSGLWGLTRCTAELSDMVLGEKMNWISPVFQIRIVNGTRHLFRMIGAGVTNDPALHGLMEITAAANGGDIDQFAGIAVYLNPEKATTDQPSGVTKMPKIAELATRLGLPEAAPAEEVAAKGIELYDSLTAAKSVLCTMLSLDPSKATNLELASAIKVRIGENGAPPAGFVTQASFDSVSAELTAAISKVKAADALSVVEAAMRGNDKGEIKITPAQKDWAIEWATRDIPNFKAWLDKAPVQVVAGRQMTNGTPAAAEDLNADGTTKIDIAAAAHKLHGIELVK